MGAISAKVTRLSGECERVTHYSWGFIGDWENLQNAKNHKTPVTDEFEALTPPWPYHGSRRGRLVELLAHVLGRMTAILRRTC